MKILFLTQYYPPESGAPQNRISDLSARLQKMGNEIDVLTAMPNYPNMKIFDNYKRKTYLKEKINNITIYRSFIFVKKSKSIIFRLFNYFSFVISSFIVGLIKLPSYDIIICESPPLFLGITAMYLSKIKKAKLIFNVSDLWPESAEKLNLIKNKFLLKLSYKLEKNIYNKSWLISGQTKGIVKNIKNRFPVKDVYLLRNGVNFEYFNIKNLTNEWRYKNNFKKDDFILLYAGIIGYAQGLDVIIKAANLLKSNVNIKFIIVGDGPEKKRLVQLNDKLKNRNVYFFDLVNRENMPSVISSCNATIIPLKRLDLFKGAIPSKIFESLAMKKPVLLGIEGEANELFIKEGNSGLEFEPENEIELATMINKLYSDKKLYNRLSENAYNYVKLKFDREKIANDFSGYINKKINA